MVPLPVIIWPSSMASAPTTAQTRAVACPARSEWPKILGDSTSTASNYLSTIDIDQSNGNMFIVGYSNA